MGLVECFADDLYQIQYAYSLPYQIYLIHMYLHADYRSRCSCRGGYNNDTGITPDNDNHVILDFFFSSS